MEHTLATERATYNAQKLADSGAYSSATALNAALQKIIRDGRPVPDQAPETPLEAAQLLIYKTVGAKTPGERRRLAEEALALSADCADAHRILAEYEQEPHLKRQRLADAIAAGRRAWEACDLEPDEDGVWGNIEIRPMLRAMAVLGMHLRAQGDLDDAIAVFGDMIEINPKDNQGIRSVLAPLLLARGDVAGFQKLDAAFGDEPTPEWAYDRALLAFREAGPASSQALRELRLGLSQNPEVAPFLRGVRPIPDRLPFAFEPGGDEEAVLYADRAGALWRDTPGALDWLTEHTANVGSTASDEIEDDDDAYDETLAFKPPSYSFPTLWRWVSLRLPSEGPIQVKDFKLSRKERQLENEVLIRIRGMKNLDRLAAMVDRLLTPGAVQAWRERMIKYGSQAAPVVLALLAPAERDKRVPLRGFYDLLALAPHLGPQFCPGLARIFDTLSDSAQALACVVFGRLAYQPGLALARPCFTRLYADFSAAEKKRETKRLQDPADGDPRFFVGPLWAMIDLGDPYCDVILRKIADEVVDCGEMYGFAARAGGPRTLETLLDDLEEALGKPLYKNETFGALVSVASLAVRLNDVGAQARLRAIIAKAAPSESLEKLAAEAPTRFKRFFS